MEQANSIEMLLPPPIFDCRDRLNKLMKKHPGANIFEHCVCAIDNNNFIKMKELCESNDIELSKYCIVMGRLYAEGHKNRYFVQYMLKLGGFCANEQCGVFVVTKNFNSKNCPRCNSHLVVSSDYLSKTLFKPETVVMYHTGKGEFCTQISKLFVSVGTFLPKHGFLSFLGKIDCACGRSYKQKHGWSNVKNFKIQNTACKIKVKAKGLK